MLHYWLFVILLKLSETTASVPSHRFNRQSEYSVECQTQNLEGGQCINIKRCPQLIELLRTRARDPQAAEFLRKSQCGFEQSTPKVCCPLSNSPIDINKTARPTPPFQATQSPINSGVRNECGKSENHGTRIVGGKNATLGDWPWMVALGYRRGRNTNVEYSICGGTLISDRFVITAAHCVTVRSLTVTTARLGDLDLDLNENDEATPQDAPVEEVIVHPEYTSSPITNDIALVRLKYPVKFSRYIKPICLFKGDQYKKDEYYAKKAPFIIGWGAVQWEGRSSTRLQQATIKIVDHAKCKQDFSSIRQAVINEKVLCAGDKGKDTCQGDSGGPLIIPVTTENSYYLGGIVSFGIKCADPNYPGIYTRVAYFSDWINQIIKI